MNGLYDTISNETDTIEIFAGNLRGFQIILAYAKIIF